MNESRRNGAREVECRAVPLQRGGAGGVLHHASYHRLGQAHHVGVVGVGLIELQHGEFRIMGPVHALVPEVVADLVDPFQPAHQQSLEIQLVRDAEVERHIQRIVMGDERARRRTAIERLQNRRLDLQKAEFVEKAADPGDRPGSEPENVSDLGMHREIGVSLAVADLGIGQTAEGALTLVRCLGLSSRQRP